MQLKCRVRRRIIDESGIRERYERYISKAVIDGIINYTPKFAVCMSFLDIKDPAKRTALVDEYVKAMKTVRQRNMVNRETKLEIGEELHSLFHPIVSATKQAAEKRRESWYW